jgi:hypothetical protein
MKRSWFVIVSVMLVVFLVGCASTQPDKHLPAIPNMGGPHGECGKLAGRVVASDTELPIREAMVYVDGKFIASTNKQGEFFIFGVTHGLYRIFITAHGYNDFQASEVQVNTDLTTLVDAPMIRR